MSDTNQSCLPYSKELEHKLFEYRNTIFNVQHPTASYFLGFQLSVGVTDEAIMYRRGKSVRGIIPYIYNILYCINYCISSVFTPQYTLVHY